MRIPCSTYWNIALKNVTEETSLAYWRIRNLLEENKDALDNSQGQHISESLLEFSTHMQFSYMQLYEWI